MEREKSHIFCVWTYEMRMRHLSAKWKTKGKHTHTLTHFIAIFYGRFQRKLLFY